MEDSPIDEQRQPTQVELLLDSHPELKDSVDLVTSWQKLTEWEIRKEFKDEKVKPCVLDLVDSLLTLVNNDQLSLSRFADGEFGLMTGTCEPAARFQNHNIGLETALKDVMTCERKLCKVALPKWMLYSSDPTISHDQSRFIANAFVPAALNGRYFDFFKEGYTYLDSCMSVPRMHYSACGRRFINAYYDICKLLLADRDIILVTGDERCFMYEKNLLKDTVKSVITIRSPRVNAWNAYESIKNALLRLNSNGNKTVVLACGPLASVLAYDLSDCMRCLDLGHIFGDYNLAMGGCEIGYFWS